MHELSLCHSVFAAAERASEGRQVAAVHLRVGQLRQVVPETLVYCWGIVTEGTALAGAELIVDHVPVTLRCGDCGATTRVARTLILTCSTCAGGNVTVLSGEEFMITTLDLVTQDAGTRDGIDAENSKGAI